MNKITKPNLFYLLTNLFLITSPLFAEKVAHQDLSSFDFLPQGIVKQACKKPGSYNEPCTLLQNMFAAVDSFARLHVEPEEKRIKHRHNEANSALELNPGNIDQKIKSMLVPAVMRIVEGELEPGLVKNEQENNNERLMQDALKMSHEFKHELSGIKKELLSKIQEEANDLRRRASQDKNVYNPSSLLAANEEYQPLYRKAEKIYSHLQHQYPLYYRIPYEKAAALKCIRKYHDNPNHPFNRYVFRDYPYSIFVDNKGLLNINFLNTDLPQIPLYKKLMELTKQKR